MRTRNKCEYILTRPILHASDFDLILAKQHIGTYKSNSTHLFSIDNNVFVSTILIRGNFKSFCGFHLLNYCYYFSAFVIRVATTGRYQDASAIACYRFGILTNYPQAC